jgi:hypothetical protein
MGYMVRMLGAMPAAVRVAPIVMPSLFPTGGIKGYSRLKEQIISDWGDAYGELRLRKQ